MRRGGGGEWRTGKREDNAIVVNYDGKNRKKNKNRIPV